MNSSFDRNRRLALKVGASALAAGLLPAGLSFKPAFAQAPTKLSFQLSWIKSIQYGGYFAGIEHGTYKKFGIEPVFNSGGPNVDPIANVASGQSVLGDRPIGPLISRARRASDQGHRNGVSEKPVQHHEPCQADPHDQGASRQDRGGCDLGPADDAQPAQRRRRRHNSVNMVPASPDPFALVSGQIDAYTGLSTNQGVMLEMRGVDILTLHVHDLGLPETAGTIYGARGFPDREPRSRGRFLRAAVESWRWALDNPETTAKLMVEKYGMPGLDTKRSSPR